MELAIGQAVRSQLADGKTDGGRLLAKQAFSKPVEIVGSHHRPLNNSAARINPDKQPAPPPPPATASGTGPHSACAAPESPPLGRIVVVFFGPSSSRGFARSSMCLATRVVALPTSGRPGNGVNVS
jgi:hypothetical protein